MNGEASVVMGPPLMRDEALALSALQYPLLHLFITGVGPGLREFLSAPLFTAQSR